MALAGALGCGGATKGMSEPSLPRVACSECWSESQPIPIATHSAVEVSTGWTGECWESYDSGGRPCSSGPLPTPGTECRESRHQCKQVPHQLAIACVGGACSAGAPVPFRGDWARTYEQTRPVTVSKPGQVILDVTFTPAGGAAKVEHVSVLAQTPDHAEVMCLGAEPNTISVQLSKAGAELFGKYVGLAATLVGSGACVRLPPDTLFQNRYRCPGPLVGATVELRQPDFVVTVPVACTAS